MLCIVFYFNYFVLIPRFVLKPGGIKWFVAINLFLCALFTVSHEVHVSTVMPATFGDMPRRGPGEPHPRGKMGPPKKDWLWGFFFMRNLVTYFFSVGASLALRLSLKWKQSEQARAEAELGRSEAELQNIKSQMNPHFLLNTLNNIYALTAFDSEKAQSAILQLSRMLRYMLYENGTERVSLRKEVEFLENYVALMRLRLPSKVDVKIVIDTPPDEDIPVAPLIFISLVENAFKHGISPIQPSFIHIYLTATRRYLKFECRNSYFPKTDDDKAPGGIGLQQVKRRLEWSYPGRYSWIYGLQSQCEGEGEEEPKTYRSVIEITDKIQS